MSNGFGEQDVDCHEAARVDQTINTKQRRVPWTYPTLLLCHMTRGLSRRGVCGTADGTRAIVVFSPTDAGEANEINNSTQRYEIIIRPLADKQGG